MNRRKSEHPQDLSISAPGASPVGVAPWAMIWRNRLQQRVDRSPRQAWIVLWTALFGLFTVQFTITILAVSLPGIARDLGADESTVDWVLTGPLLGFAITGPAAGKLADRYGHRNVYLVGLASAMVFSLLAGLAWSAASLITFRVLGAVLGSATGPSSMAMINQLFAPQERSQAMGYWSFVAAGGPVFGVAVGGPIVEEFGWRWIFIGQVPLIAAGLMLAIAILPVPENPPVRRPIDIVGILLLGAGALALMLAINRAPRLGWDSPVVIAGFIVGPLLLAAFVFWERRTVSPLLPLQYFSRRNFVFPVVGQSLAMFAYMGGFYLTPFLLEKLFDYDETRIGLTILPRPIAFAIAGPLAGYLAVRIGERTSAVFGTLAIAVSMFALATISQDSGTAILLGALVLSGVGLGFTSPVMASTIANAVDDEDLGIAGAAQQMMSQIGIVTGITVLLAVQRSHLSQSGLDPGDVGYLDAVEDSFSVAFVVGGIVALGAVVCASFVRSVKDDPALASASTS